MSIYFSVWSLVDLNEKAMARMYFDDYLKPILFFNEASFKDVFTTIVYDHGHQYHKRDYARYYAR
jgi:hypothetical protein